MYAYAYKVSGGNCGGETPVPIPNTEVKTASADGTWGGTPWESRSSPGFVRRPRRASDRRGGGVLAFARVRGRYARIPLWNGTASHGRRTTRRQPAGTPTGEGTDRV